MNIVFSLQYFSYKFSSYCRFSTCLAYDDWKIRRLSILMNFSVCWNILPDCCNCGTTDSDSSSSSGSELDTAKASEPLSSKVIGVHTVSKIMLFIECNFHMLWPFYLLKNRYELQENAGPGLTYNQNRGDPSNPETENGGSQTLWAFVTMCIL